MKFNVEDLKRYKECNTEVLKAVKDNYNIEEDLENAETIILEGVSYSLIQVESSEWISGGKYEDQTVTYQLVSFDETKTSYPCKDNLIDYYNIFLEQFVSRTGSYYTDWEYYYNEPSIKRYIIVDVPEVIVPAHKEISHEWIDKDEIE
jgi:hypothetical protein